MYSGRYFRSSRKGDSSRYSLKVTQDCSWPKLPSRLRPSTEKGPFSQLLCPPAWQQTCTQCAHRMDPSFHRRRNLWIFNLYFASCPSFSNFCMVAQRAPPPGSNSKNLVCIDRNRCFRVQDTTKGSFVFILPKLFTLVSS